MSSIMDAESGCRTPGPIQKEVIREKRLLAITVGALYRIVEGGGTAETLKEVAQRALMDFAQESVK